MDVSPPESGGLRRELSTRQLTMIGIGGAIGTGLFLGSTFAVSQAGPGVVVAYTRCGLVALVIAWALAERSDGAQFPTPRPGMNAGG